MPRKTFCIFSTFYLPNYSGVEKYTFNLASALVRASHSVIIVTSALNDDVGIVDEDGITVVRIPSHVLVDGRFAAPRCGKGLNELIHWLDEQPIDLVLVNQRFYPTSIFGLKYAEKRAAPAIILDHGSAHLTMSNPFMDFFVEAYEHIVTSIGKRHPSRYYAVSEKSAEWLGHFGIDASGVLHNAIDADDFVVKSSGRDFRGELGIPDDSLAVVYTGRLLEMKGVMVACEAVGEMAHKGEGVHLLLAGDGPLRQRIEQMDDPHIHLLGRLPVEDVSALLSQSDVFCLPTESEGFSTSMLEAAAHGLGIVVTDTGGARELIPDDSYGIVIPDNAIKTVVAALSHFFEDRIYLHECGRNVSARVRELFNWKHTAEALVRAFE